jgi:hypothetical protein
MTLNRPGRRRALRLTSSQAQREAAMKTDPDDAARLLALLVAICGEQINGYRPKIEALVATLNANARLVKDWRASRNRRVGW